jgi:tRNA threonylcarbamoyl adenosine modification protein (Sua5/YciO/YrdC/YwlC family)
LPAAILRIDADNPESERVNQVANAIAAGNVVGLPTDTFYGLAVDPVNLRAVDKIYEMKSRARQKPLSLLVHDVQHAYELARDLDGRFDALAESFWPGPLTLIVRAGTRLPLRVTANTGNVALRVPAAEVPRAVIRRLGLPVTATSANLAQEPECTDAASLDRQLGHLLPLIVDGGPSPCGVATTIIDLSGPGWHVVREGAIPTHCIALALQN